MFRNDRQRFQLPGRRQRKEPACSAGDVRDFGSIPGWGRSPGGGDGSPLQYSCLENSMDSGACLATVHGVAKSRTRLKGLRTHACMYVFTDDRVSPESVEFGGYR